MQKTISTYTLNLLKVVFKDNWGCGKAKVAFSHATGFGKGQKVSQVSFYPPN